MWRLVSLCKRCRICTVQFNLENLRDQLVAVTERLRSPAGDDTRFQSIDGIEANRFVASVHSTWKELHLGTVNEIVRIEEAMQDAGRSPTFVAYLKLLRQIMRR